MNPDYFAFSDNRQILGDIDGIDVILQQLAVRFYNFIIKKKMRRNNYIISKQIMTQILGKNAFYFSICKTESKYIISSMY